MIALMFCVSLTSAAEHPGDDWYHPRPPSLPDKDTPLILPWSVERPVVPVPVVTLTLALSELRDTGIIPLSADRWAKLRIPLSPDELLTRLIEQNQQPNVFPLLGGLASMPRHADEISHWKSLKNQGLKPYLVRAVAAEGDQSEFCAHVWHDALTIVHCSMIKGDFANDPLHQHAAIMRNPTDIHAMKSPVIVYLEHEPKVVFTELQIVKGGL